MLESTNPDLVAHQGSPTKHPAIRLQTIRDAGELKIPFTSGILVGIGESEEDRMASLEALAGFDHIQEIILQNFVPHRRYYGEEPAEIATEAAERYWAHGPLRRAAPRPAEVGVPGQHRGHDAARAGDAAADARASASRSRPTSRTGGRSWSRPGATDLGGLSSNGDHISPEHPFPSPKQVRERLQGIAAASRAAVRLPAVHERGVDRAARARRDPAPSTARFMPRRTQPGVRPETRSSAPATAAAWPRRSSRRCSPRAAPR